MPMVFLIITRRNRLIQEFPDDDFNESTDCEIYLELLKATSTTKLVREWYIYPRSTHWLYTLFNSPRNFFIDAEFQSTFRMSRDSFEVLLARLSPFIEKQSTRFREPHPPNARLTVFLYHVALGVPYTAIANQFAMGKSTVGDIVGQVSQAICQHLSKEFIRFPSTDEALQSMEYWQRQTGIPGIVSCFDGSHIPIVRPSEHGDGYFNRKHFYSINVQGIKSFFEVLTI